MRNLFFILFLSGFQTVVALACDKNTLEMNAVTVQYGFERYPCRTVTAERKKVIFDIIYKGYVEQGGVLTYEYIRKRWERVEPSFWKVWATAPLWQARVAAAICSKEYLCGVAIEDWRWDEFRFESKRNGNGTIDCGITQINTGSTRYSCDQLQDLAVAFKEQRRIIKVKVRASDELAVWKARISRYNGSGRKAREYAKLVFKWAGL